MDYLQQCKLQEKGDAEVFAAQFQDRLIYDHLEKQWYIFNGHVWEEDTYAHSLNLIERVASLYEEELHNSSVDPTGRQYRFYKARIDSLRNKSGIQNALGLAKAKMPLKEEWDNNPYLLAVKNGVINLKTGEFRPGKPDDYLRSFSEVEWKGFDEKAPRWEQFLQELFPENPEIPEFLQRMFGYATSGLSVEHVFAVFYGAKGRNGKDVMLETISNVLGEKIAGTIKEEVLLSGFKNPGAANPFLMDLVGKRLVYADETNEQASFDSAQMKRLSGGSPFKARQLRQKAITIKPQYLIVLTSNARPIVDADDDALWERLICVEYTQRFTDNIQTENDHAPDKFLKEKLKKEYSGILTWLVKGFLEWQEKGLAIPDVVKYNTAAYRDQQDSLGRFIKDECLKETGVEVSVKQLYAAYRAWDDGQKKLTQQEFRRKMEERYPKKRLASGMFYEDICLKKYADNELEILLDGFAKQ